MYKYCMEDDMAHPGGRPTEYNPDIAKKICESVACTTLGIRKICKLNPDLPNPDTIFKWRYRHKEFAEQYTQAKRAQAELMAEEIIDIADEGENDTYVDDDGIVKVNFDIVARSRLRVDTRKWLASKLAPKIYSDKQIAPTNDTSDTDERISEAANAYQKSY